MNLGEERQKFGKFGSNVAMIVAIHSLFFERLATDVCWNSEFSGPFDMVLVLCVCDSHKRC